MLLAEAASRLRATITAVTLVTATFVLVLLGNGCNRTPESAPASSIPEVATVEVRTEPVVLTTELPGRTSAFRIAEIRPQVSGLIQRRLFQEGSEVKAGQILYQIDPAPFQAAFENAVAQLTSAREAAERARAALKAGMANVSRQRATLELARANHRRLAELFEGGFVSASQLDQAVTEVEVAEASLRAAEAQMESDRKALAAAEAAVQQAEAALKVARINLGYTRICAPISGRISKSNVTEGALVTAHQALPLATIQQLDPIFVDVPQSTAELSRWQKRLEEGGLKAGGTSQRKVKLLLEDGSPYPWEGTLQFRDVTVEVSTGSVLLRALFPNPKGILLPGMFVRAVVQEGIAREAILIPQQAVVRDPKGNPLALVVDKSSKVEQRMLTLDRALDDKWLVASGLSAGDRVIVEGLLKVRPGMAVKEVPWVVVPAEEKKKAGAASPAAPGSR